MIPLYINLGNTKRVAGSVVYAHFHDIVIDFQRAVRYTCNSIATDGSGGDGWSKAW